ncbi:MAG: sulfatase-like hydrolase/transferase, partial [Gemmatimonadetes bacterium]|nr:sulfatase-like hydrolase/transferase [Gemmatimonadota bacterium]
PATPDSSLDVGVYALLGPHRPASHNEADVSDKPTWIRQLALWTSTKMRQVDRLYRKRAETLRSVDRLVEQVVLALQRRGTLDDTVLVFTSDHGFLLGEHRHKAKWCPHEECVNVPLLVRAPAVAPRRDMSLVSNVDIAPTLADFAGALPRRKMDGLSLRPLLYGAIPLARDAVLLELLGYPFLNRRFSAVRTDRWMYAEYQNGERELYDMLGDPGQLRSRASESVFADTVAILSARLRILKAQ